MEDSARPDAIAMSRTVLPSASPVATRLSAGGEAEGRPHQSGIEARGQAGAGNQHQHPTPRAPKSIWRRVTGWTCRVSPGATRGCHTSMEPPAGCASRAGRAAATSRDRRAVENDEQFHSASLWMALTDPQSRFLPAKTVQCPLHQGRQSPCHYKRRRAP